MERNEEKKQKKDFFIVGDVILYLIPITICLITIMIDIAVIRNVDESWFNPETIITNLVSIFGIIVSVWVGINITNMIDHRKLEKMQVDILDYQTKIDNVNKSLGATKDSLRQQLIDQYRNEDEVAINHIFANKLDLIHNDNNISLETYSYVLQAEKIYNIIRSSRNKKWAVDSDYLNDLFILMKKIYNKIINNLNYNRLDYKDLDDNVSDNDIIYEIIEIRYMETIFLMGYLKDDENYFKKAVQYYDSSNIHLYGYELSELRHIDLDIFKNKMLEFDEKTLQIIAYLFNFIGESYSKIVEYENKNINCIQNMDELKKDTILCFEKSIYCSILANHERETYYRNYGCAIERVNKKDLNVIDLNKALELYKKALLIDQDNDKIYHCITSICNTILTKNTNNQERYEQILDCFYTTQYIYIKKYPTSVDAYRMSILYYLRLYDYKKIDSVVDEIRLRINVLKILDKDFETSWILKEIAKTINIDYSIL